MTLLVSTCMHIVMKLCNCLGYTYERLDGSVRGEERFLAIKNFAENDETFVFLLSTRAGQLFSRNSSVDVHYYYH